MTHRGILSTTHRGILLLLTASLGALQAQTGAYHFVQLSIRGSGPTLEARNAGGTVTFTGNQAAFTGQFGIGALAAKPLTATSTFADSKLANPLVAGQSLELRANQNASVLIGSSAGGTPDGSYDLLVAVRQGPLARPLQGSYNAAYFAVKDSRATGLTTAFLDFTGGPGM